jgi:hypothetical protein
MSAKNRPVSKPMSQQFAENYDRIFGKAVAEKPEVIEAQDKKTSLLRAKVDAMPMGKDLQFKDPIKLGMSPSAEVINIDTHDKEQWEGFTATEKEDE